ncbi:hypothetical protein AAMO2058_001058200 [Amorphochlora amoebiformis]
MPRSEPCIEDTAKSRKSPKHGRMPSLRLPGISKCGGKSAGEYELPTKAWQQHRRIINETLHKPDIDPNSREMRLAATKSKIKKTSLSSAPGVIPNLTGLPVINRLYSWVPFSPYADILRGKRRAGSPPIHSKRPLRYRNDGRQSHRPREKSPPISADPWKHLPDSSRRQEAERPVKNLKMCAQIESSDPIFRKKRATSLAPGRGRRGGGVESGSRSPNTPSRRPHPSWWSPTKKMEDYADDRWPKIKKSKPLSPSYQRKLKKEIKKSSPMSPTYQRKLRRHLGSKNASKHSYVSRSANASLAMWGGKKRLKLKKKRKKKEKQVGERVVCSLAMPEPEAWQTPNKSEDSFRNIFRPVEHEYDLSNYRKKDDILTKLEGDLEEKRRHEKKTVNLMEKRGRQQKIEAARRKLERKQQRERKRREEKLKKEAILELEEEKKEKAANRPQVSKNDFDQDDVDKEFIASARRGTLSRPGSKIMNSVVVPLPEDMETVDQHEGTGEPQDNTSGCPRGGTGCAVSPSDGTCATCGGDLPVLTGYSSRLSIISNQSNARNNSIHSQRKKSEMNQIQEEKEHDAEMKPGLVQAEGEREEGEGVEGYCPIDLGGEDKTTLEEEDDYVADRTFQQQFRKLLLSSSRCPISMGSALCTPEDCTCGASSDPSSSPNKDLLSNLLESGYCPITVGAPECSPQKCTCGMQKVSLGILAEPNAIYREEESGFRKDEIPSYCPISMAGKPLCAPQNCTCGVMVDDNLFGGDPLDPPGVDF